jgi:ABC-type thiamine transport system ATPase subunit
MGRFHIANLAPVPIGRLRASDRLTVALAAALLAERPFVVLDEPEAVVPPGCREVRSNRSRPRRESYGREGSYGTKTA